MIRPPAPRPSGADDGTPPPLPPARASLVKAVLWLLAAAAALSITVVAAAVLPAADRDDNGYRTSPVCAPGPDAAQLSAAGHCRYPAPAVVTARKAEAGTGGANYIKVAAVNPADHLQRGRISLTNGVARHLHIGDPVDVLLWRGSATGLRVHNRILPVVGPPAPTYVMAGGVMLIFVTLALPCLDAGLAGLRARRRSLPLSHGTSVRIWYGGRVATAVAGATLVAAVTGAGYWHGIVPLVVVWLALVTVALVVLRRYVLAARHPLPQDTAPATGIRGLLGEGGVSPWRPGRARREGRIHAAGGTVLVQAYANTRRRPAPEAPHRPGRAERDGGAPPPAVPDGALTLVVGPEALAYTTTPEGAPSRLVQRLLHRRVVPLTPFPLAETRVLDVSPVVHGWDFPHYWRVVECDCAGRLLRIAVRPEHVWMVCDALTRVPQSALG